MDNVHNTMYNNPKTIKRYTTVTMIRRNASNAIQAPEKKKHAQ